MSEFRRASVVDGLRFTAQIGVPQVVLGLFKKRRLPMKVASLARADAQGFHLVKGLVERNGPGPFLIRVATDEALLLHAPEDIEFVLGGSPDPFASDPDTKRKGMSAFQPDALTISRGDEWRNRRAFAESVLATGKPLHPLAPRFLTILREAVGALAQLDTVTWPDVNQSFQRITRRVVFGDRAGGDVELSARLGALMAAGNRTPGKPADGYDEFLASIQAYVDDPDPNSLTGAFAEAPHDATTNVAGQAIHWLFAMGDTLPLNLMRTLVLLATHPEQLHEVRAEIAAIDIDRAEDVAGLDYTAGCILEAMRLWPTTALFGRVTTQKVTFPSGETLPADTQVLIYNVFNHRDPSRVPFADDFAPGEWASGDASQSWQFNFFSHGPQGCPGAGLSVFLGQAFLTRLLALWTPSVDGVSLDPGQPLPHGLEVNGVSIGLSRRG
jgi:cytochrome P450